MVFIWISIWINHVGPYFVVPSSKLNSAYSALYNKPESMHAGFLFVQIYLVPKQIISHKLLSFPAIAWPQSQCRCKDSPSNW